MAKQTAQPAAQAPQHNAHVASKQAAAAAPMLPPPAPVAPPAAPAVRGAVTTARWGACLQGQGQPTMPAAIKALALTTVLVCNVAQNPKRNRHNVFVYPFANAQGVAGLAAGNTCTLAQYYTALAQTGGGNATAGAAHVAWDLNHGYIAIVSVAQAPAPLAQAA